MPPRNNPPQRRIKLEVSELYSFPVKSAAAVATDTLTIDPMGVAGDRAFMLVDDCAKPVTARERPRLMQIMARWDGETLSLAYPDIDPLQFIPDSNAAPETINVWRDSVLCTPASPQVDAWLASVLGIDCRLMQMGAKGRRTGGSSLTPPNNFSDASPVLVTTSASVDALNEQLERPVTSINFRPNIVINGTEPHAEDNWRQIRVGDVILHAESLCTRCVMTTIDPATAIKAPDMEPMKTLGRYRRRKDGQICFGVYMVPVNAGEIRICDTVEFL